MRFLFKKITFCFLHLASCFLLIAALNVQAQTTSLFTDASLTAKTVSAYGDATVVAGQSKFAGPVGTFDGAGDYLVVSPSPLDSSPKAFTVEAWIYISSVPANGWPIVSQSANGVAGAQQLFVSGSNGGTANQNKLRFSRGADATNAIDLIGTTTLPLNQWVHVALSSDGITAKLFVNGNVDNSIALASGWIDTAQAFYVATTLTTSAPQNQSFAKGKMSDFRITKNSARYKNAFIPYAAEKIDSTQTLDPNWGESVLLLTGNGRNDSVNFVDSSPATKKFSVIGNAKISSTQAKYGGSSVYFDGNDDYLLADAGSNFEFGSEDFTVEAWVYINDNSNLDASGRRLAEIFSIDNQWNAEPFIFYINGNSTTTGTALGIYSSSTNSGVETNVTITQKAWHHVAASRSNGIVNLFLDGNKIASASWTSNISALGYKAAIGGRSWSTNYHYGLNGYIDDLRVTKGIARYTANFTPAEIPSVPIKTGDAQWSNVSFLLNANGINAGTNFFDLSASAQIISPADNVKISTAQTKFGGASALFDGSGDYLSLPASSSWDLDLADFTVESWVYLTSDSAVNGRGIRDAVIVANTNLVETAYWSFYIGGSSTVTGTNLGWYQNNGTNAAGWQVNYSFNKNTWYHVAMVRSSGVLTAYINGVSVGSSAEFSLKKTGNSTGVLGVGRHILSTNNPYLDDFNGNIDDLRITKGIARYTANFTPPTTQLEPPRFVKDPYTSRVSLLLLSGAAAIDPVFPYITGTSNITNTASALDSIKINFNKSIEETSFTIAQAILTDATQKIIPISSTSKITSTEYKINFVPALLAGTYNLKVFPDILGANGLALDQNRNGVGGEALDVFEKSIVVNYAAPSAITPTASTLSGTGTSVTLTWPAYIKPSNGRDISVFRIYTSLNPFTTIGQATKVLEVAGTATTATVTGLLNNTTYYVAVVPVDTAGNYASQVTPIAVKPLSASEQTTSYTYNAAGQILTEDGPRTDVNDTTTYTYDAAGNRATMTNAVGHVLRYNSYDGVGRLLSVTDANSVTTEFTYHDRGWLLSSRIKHPTTSALDSLTTYTYDAVGLMISMTLPNGYVIGYEYDDARRLKAIKNAAGERIEYTVDAAGNRTQQIIKNNGGTITYSVAQAFDELSRVMSITGNHSQNEQHKYDANDNTTAVIDGKTNKTQQTFDALNRVAKIIDPNLKETQFTYDAQNRIKTVTDARGNITAYNFDGLGNLISQTSPDTGTTRFSYDASGNRTSAIDARGVVVNYTYDAINRLTLVSYPATSTENVAYSYDATANGNYGLGRLTKVAIGTTSVSYTYNYLGLISQKSVVVNGITRVINYTYDTAGNLSSMTYPSGRIVTYVRDNAGRIQTIKTKVNSAAADQTVISAANYLPFGPVTSYTYGNGLSHTMTYDTDYRLTSIQLGGLMVRNYSYDAVDNIIKMIDGVTTTKTQTFTYDNIDRLSSANGIYGYQAFSYDAVGNRTGFLFDNGTAIQSDTYNYETTNNRLSRIDKTSAGLSTGNRTFTYDSAGNRTQGTGDDGIDQTYTYNPANRLATTKVNASLVGTYTYNALGQRVIKTYADNTKELFHYDESGQLISVTNASGTILREYIYNGNTLVGYINAGVLVYVHNDHHNTPQVVTAQNQSVVWMADYEPFGKAKLNASNSINFSARFPGQYLDSETGLYYNYFRDYDPSIGRYIESDPIGLRGGINTYAYVEGNPMAGVDPTGEQTTYDSWCRKNPVACAEVFPPTPKPVPKPKPQESCPPAPPPPPPKDDDDGCRKATDWQLNTLGITDPHSFKADYVTGSISKYDICVCNGGAIKIKGAGKCGTPGPSIETY